MIAALLDISGSGLQLDQLRLTVGSPDGGSEEEKHHTLIPHQGRDGAWLAGLIERHPDIRRPTAGGRAEILRGDSMDQSTDGQNR